MMTAPPEATPDAAGEPPRRTQISRTWSRAANFFLAAQPEAKSADRKKLLNAVLGRAIKIALAQPPLYPELQSALKKAPESPFQIDCFWVDDAEIQRMNREHRGKDKPTDVLSFPLFEGEVFVFPGEDLSLGDLVISVETAARQSGELNHSLEHEVAFLAIHGALHLLGYDHQTDAQRRKMFALQDELFAVWQTQHEKSQNGRSQKEREQGV